MGYSDRQSRSAQLGKLGGMGQGRCIEAGVIQVIFERRKRCGSYYGDPTGS